MDADEKIGREWGRPFRNRFRLGAAFVLGNERVRRRAMFFTNQRRSEFQDRRPAVFGSLRSHGRRQDGPQIRREPLHQAGLVGQYSPRESGDRCQRHACVDGVRGRPDLGLRSQRRSTATTERARAFERL